MHYNAFICVLRLGKWGNGIRYHFWGELGCNRAKNDEYDVFRGHCRKDTFLKAVRTEMIIFKGKPVLRRHITKTMATTEIIILGAIIMFLHWRYYFQFWRRRSRYNILLSSTN